MKQPRDSTVCKGTYGSFSVSVSGSQLSYTYQWYEKLGNGNWNMLSAPDAKGPTYTTKDAGTYRCVVTEKSPATGQETSQEATLSVHDRPYFTGIVAPEVCNGSDLTATAVNVINNGSNLTHYEWFLPDTILQSGPLSSNTVPDLVYHNAQNKRSEQILSLKLTNGCGSITSSNTTTPLSVPITIWDTPGLPTPEARTHCEGAVVTPMSSGVSTAIWYDAPAGGSVIPVPTPDTSIPGVQTWWVSQTNTYGTLVCESGRAPATATIFPLPAPPNFTPETTLCLGDPYITLTATGTEVIQWYDYREKELPAAPQINTSTAGEQIYFVTQISIHGTLKCQSPIESGKNTVLIMDRANEQALTLSYASLLCPNTSTVIEAISQVPNSTIRWYSNIDKTGLVHTGSTFTTPVLVHNTNYYATLEYSGVCESASPQSAIIKVEDDTLPEITAPLNRVVNTNDGVCYATNVDTGQPLVSDNCTDMSNLLVYTDPAAPTTYLLGDTTLMWWVEDEAGNKYYALQTISVRDRENPRGTCPADIIKEVDEDVTSAVITYSLNYTDNCSPVKYVMTTTGTASGSVFPLGTTPVRYEITDSAGNTEVCEFKVIVRHPYRPMEVTLKPSTYEICPGEEVILTAVISGGSGTYVYSWNPRTWTDPMLKDYPTVSTVYEVTVNDGITTQTKSVNVAVLEIQQVALTLQGRPMDEIFEGDEVLVTASLGFASYKLLLNNKVVQEAGLNNAVSFQAELGTYYVRTFATDVNFCVSQDQIRIDVDSRKLPNVFTPNHDGKNDTFLEGFDLQVFSRAGELLYEGTNGWDGVYKGKLLPQGTYLYVVKRTMNNGERRLFKGTVTLKK